MSNDAHEMLAEFARKIREMTDRLNASKGKGTEQLQMELSMYIGNGMQALMSAGLSVAEIQEAVRAATETVPQTHAQDDDGTGGRDISDPPIIPVIHLIPMDEAVIDAFASGGIDSGELMDIIDSSLDMASIVMESALELILTDYGKYAEADISCGEIVTGEDGEAFTHDPLDVPGTDGGYGGVVAEPMVFKDPSEVRMLCDLLSSISEKTFLKRADLKKLIKAGWAPGCDYKDLREDEDEITGNLLYEFRELQKVYSKAAEQNKGMAIFADHERDD